MRIVLEYNYDSEDFERFLIEVLERLKALRYSKKVVVEIVSE